MKPLEILFEDDEMLAVNKPAGILSQPNLKKEPDILQMAKDAGVALCGGDDPERYGLVHRLDRDTSGVLLLSKTQESYQNLQDQFRLRKVLKRYHFIAYGSVRKMEFTCKDPIGRNPKKRHTRIVIEGGRDAETHFKLLKLCNINYSIWEAHPKTGRTHQIRVHARESGLSILGDPYYSKNKQFTGLKDAIPDRTMLHCRGLSIKHPSRDEILSFDASYPEDFSFLKEKVEGL